MKTRIALFALLALILYYPLLIVGHGTIDFHDGVITNQFMAHMGLQEIYLHIYSGFILFIISVISVVVLYDYFKDSKYTWKPVMAGILSTGLIGLGEGAEHLFATFGHEVFHYTHMLGAPVAMYFLYVGAREYTMQYREGGRPIGFKTTIGLMFLVFIVSVVIASFARVEWDPVIERPFIYIIATPVVVLSFLTLKEANEQYEMQKVLRYYLSLLAISVMLLSIVIMLGRDADIIGSAYLYMVAHSFQAILLVVNATFIMSFTISMHIMMNMDGGLSHNSNSGTTRTLQ